MHKPKSPYFVAAVTAKKYQSTAGPEGASNAFSFSIEFALLLRIGGKFIGETETKAGDSHLRCLWLQTFVWLGHVESSYIGLLKYMPIPLNLH